MAAVAVRMMPSSSTRSSSRRKRIRSRGDDAEGESSAVSAHLQAPSQRIRPLSLTEHVDKMAQSCQRYMEKIRALVNAGLLDRRKLVEHVRIVGGFRDATGVDVTHGMLELFHYLLPQLPITQEDEQQAQQIQELGRGGRRAAVAADSSLPYEVDEMACYLKSFGGRGAEHVECSEAFKQLFMSTDEVMATVGKHHVTSMSVLACVLSTEALAQLFEAMAVVFFQKGGPTEVEVEHMECRTRLGLQLACRALVSFRLHANGESTLTLVLTVKPQQQDELAPPSRQHPGVPRQSLKPEMQEPQQEGEEPSTRRSHTSVRLAALAARKQERALAQQQAQQVQQQYPDDSRPPAKRAPVSSRRRSPAPVAWSQEGPVPQSMVERLLARSPSLANAVGGCWCRDEATGAVVWCGSGEDAPGCCLPLSAAGARRFAHSAAFAQQLQELERQERRDGVAVAAAPVVAVAAEAPKAEAEDEKSIAPFAFEEQGRGQPKPAAFFPLEPAPAAGVMALIRGDSNASRSSAASSSASSSSTAAQEEDDDDEVWAWADFLWEGGLNGLGLGDGDEGCALVTSPDVWALLEQPPLFDSMGLL